MNENEGQLHALLQQWPDIDPPSNFEAQVWRRIRSGRAVPVRRPWFWLWHPALAAATAVLVSASVTWLAQSPPREMQFLSAGTLTGAYLQVRR